MHSTTETDPLLDGDAFQATDAGQIRPQSAIGQDLPATEELNGPKGPEPTRYGDWERKGRCVDF